jgi:hypothetical protein
MASNAPNSAQVPALPSPTQQKPVHTSAFAQAIEKLSEADSAAVRQAIERQNQEHKTNKVAKDARVKKEKTLLK